LPSSPNGYRRGAAKSNARVLLDGAQSAVLREKLLAEVASLTSAEFAVTWATRALPAKNSLITADAKLLEEAFEQKLSGLSAEVEILTRKSAASEATAQGQTRPSQPAAAEHDQACGIDKSALAVAAPRRYRNREHLRYVAQHACLICGRKPSDPHHLSFTQPRALGSQGEW
jgi:hypothetical protein